jgi:hypothetical protein
MLYLTVTLICCLVFIIAYHMGHTIGEEKGHSQGYKDGHIQGWLMTKIYGVETVKNAYQYRDDYMVLGHLGEKE